MGVPMYLKGRLKCASFFSTCATLSARAPRGQTLGSVRFLQWLLATSQPEGEGDGENDTRTTFEGMKQKATEDGQAPPDNNTTLALPCHASMLQCLTPSPPTLKPPPAPRHG